MKNAANVERYIKNKGGNIDKFLLKDRGTGAGNYFAEWDQPFAKPTNAQLAVIHEVVEAEKQAKKDDMKKRVNPRKLAKLLLDKGLITKEEINSVRED